MMRLISAGVGMSTPTSSLRLPRLSRRSTRRRTFCDVSARFAALSSDLRLVSTFLRHRRDKSANNRRGRR